MSATTISIEESKMQQRQASSGTVDYLKVRELTELELTWFRSDLDIFDLLNPDAPYSLDRCRHMQMLLRMLSRNKRSVQIALTVLSVIFTTRDVEQLVG